MDPVQPAHGGWDGACHSWHSVDLIRDVAKRPKEF